MQMVDVCPNVNVTFDMQKSTKWQSWADVCVKSHIDVTHQMSPIRSQDWYLLGIGLKSCPILRIGIGSIADPIPIYRMIGIGWSNPIQATRELSIGFLGQSSFPTDPWSLHYSTTTTSPPHQPPLAISRQVGVARQQQFPDTTDLTHHGTAPLAPPLSA
ncbi:hypothetical protein PGTUg99_000590 [Puccinia graminis f. sp. tritici]|uniref:Uncharacterized protein n=1 Tax=Puccinia graminis f. sp. tritici TaxID=56615 RepID=A0A5B0RW47_PUCGR|nr:hypothetical protein PGTUg99_000590 [Puccinia graminis f. sp. tritici]